MNWLNEKRIKIAEEIVQNVDEKKVSKKYLTDNIKYLKKVSYLLMIGLPIVSIMFLFQNQEGLGVIDSIFPIFMGSILAPFMLFEISAEKLAFEKIEEKELSNNVAEIKQHLDNDFTNVFEQRNDDEMESLNNNQEDVKFNNKV